MADRTIALHIGLPHAGSTTIRHLLSDNRDALAAHGILYPRSPGIRSHADLVTYALPTATIEAHRRRAGLRTAAEVEAFRGAFEAAFAEELAAAPGCDRVVLSAEHLSWALTRREDLARLKQFLQRHGSVDRVVVYLRRQADVLLSLHANSIKRGRTAPSLVRSILEIRSFDYRRMLRLWGEAFGEDALCVRLLSASDLRGGDLQEDAIEALGLPRKAMPERAGVANEGLDAAALSLLQLMNRHFPAEDGTMSHAARTLVEALRATRSGAKLTVAGWQLRPFTALFRAGNREIARRWFGRDELFPTDGPSGDRAELRPLDLEEAAGIMAAAWMYREDQIKRRGATATGPAGGDEDGPGEGARVRRGRRKSLLDGKSLRE